MLQKRAPLWREAHSEAKGVKTHHARTTFGSRDVEQMHAVVVRSIFVRENVQNTSGPDPEHFWHYLEKMHGRCGAKCIWK